MQESRDSLQRARLNKTQSRLKTQGFKAQGQAGAGTACGDQHDANPAN